MLTAASFAQASATHESRAAPPPSHNLFCSDGASSPGRALGQRGRNGSRRTTHERQGTPGAKLPLQVEETRTSGTGSPQHVAKGRADLKLVGQVCLARWAGTTFRQFGKPGLFIDALLVSLRPRLARTEEQREKEAAEKEERYQEREDALEPAMGGACMTITPDPNHQADPETKYTYQGTSTQQIEHSGEHRGGVTFRKDKQKHQTDSFFTPWRKLTRARVAMPVGSNTTGKTANRSYSQLCVLLTMCMPWRCLPVSEHFQPLSH